VRTLALPGFYAGAEGVSDTTRPTGAVTTAPQQTAPRLRRGRARISGTVKTLGGTPISGARVSVTGAEGSALTNERGEFVLAGQPAGSQTVVVRKLGYDPAEFAVNLSPTRPMEVSVDLPEFVPVLSTVVVRAQMDVALDRIGFTQRKKVGLGRFMGLEDIERRGAQRVVDLLAEFPMLRAVSTGGSGRQITGRTRGMGTNCVTFYVDGAVWMGDDAPTDYMLPQEIGAIEAYSAGSTPAEYTRGFHACETVVIWTKHKLGIIR
jgi:hypothetical protein